MAKGPIITNEILQLIARVYLENPEWRAKEIQREVNIRLRKGNPRVTPGWPGLSAVQKELTKIRKGNIVEQAKRLEEPWSLGASVQLEYEITPEATDDLLAVWRICLAVGHVFTIREAQWVARIRTAMSADRRRLGLLFSYAHEYAIRERVSSISNKPMDTRDLDASISRYIYDWDDVVFRALGVIPRLTTKYYIDELSEYNFEFTVSSAEYVAEHNIPLNARKEQGGQIDINKIGSLWHELSEIQDRTYAALLLYLSKGPLWNTLSAMEYMSILDYLMELVTKEMPNNDTITYHNLDFSSYYDRPNGLAPEDALSPDLLKAVGYEVNTYTATVDNPYPHIRDYSKSRRYKAAYKSPKNTTTKGGTP